MYKQWQNFLQDELHVLACNENQGQGQILIMHIQFCCQVALEVHQDFLVAAEKQIQG